MAADHRDPALRPLARLVVEELHAEAREPEEADERGEWFKADWPIEDMCREMRKNGLLYHRFDDYWEISGYGLHVLKQRDMEIGRQKLAAWNAAVRGRGQV